MYISTTARLWGCPPDWMGNVCQMSSALECYWQKQIVVFHRIRGPCAYVIYTGEKHPRNLFRSTGTILIMGLHSWSLHMLCDVSIRGTSHEITGRESEVQGGVCRYRICHWFQLRVPGFCFPTLDVNQTVSNRHSMYQEMHRFATRFLIILPSQGHPNFPNLNFAASSSTKWTLTSPWLEWHRMTRYLSVVPGGGYGKFLSQFGTGCCGLDHLWGDLWSLKSTTRSASSSHRTSRVSFVKGVPWLNMEPGSTHSGCVCVCVC